jgi:hypothetical protein
MPPPENPGKEIQEKSESTQGKERDDAPNPTRQGLTTIIALGLLISFVLPWFRWFNTPLSGYQLQSNFSSYRYVWIMPLLALIVVVLQIVRLSSKNITQLAGITPLMSFCYASYRLRVHPMELAKGLEYGAWTALICGILLFSASYNQKNPPPKV